MRYLLAPVICFFALTASASGACVQLQYAHTAEYQSRLTKIEPDLVKSVENTKAWFARETDGRLTINYCPSIKAVALGTASSYQTRGGLWMPTVHNAIRGEAHTLTFIDGLNSPDKAGQAEIVWQGFTETNPQLSPFATRALSAIVWLGSRPLTDETVPELYPRTIAHETLHILGAVSPDSPNGDGLAHCLDGHDILCPKQEGPCPMTDNIGRLDCGRDDYFNENPAPGSYLANRWNVANSPYLVKLPKPEPKPTPVVETSRSTKKTKLGRRQIEVTRINYSDGRSNIIFAQRRGLLYCLDRLCDRQWQKSTTKPAVKAWVKQGKKKSKPTLMVWQ